MAPTDLFTVENEAGKFHTEILCLRLSSGVHAGYGGPGSSGRQQHRPCSVSHRRLVLPMDGHLQELHLGCQVRTCSYFRFPVLPWDGLLIREGGTEAMPRKQVQQTGFSQRIVVFRTLGTPCHVVLSCDEPGMRSQLECAG